MSDSVDCAEPGCDNSILASTAQETGGICMACVNRRKAAERRAFIEANRVDVDRFEGVTDPVEILKILEEPPKFDPLIRYTPYEMEGWQVYAGLNSAQLESMVDYAIERAGDNPRSAETIALALASFTEIDLTRLQQFFLGRESWPPEIYRSSSREIRDRWLRAIEVDTQRETLPLNLLLLTLAWIGDETVARRFHEWRNNPPEWTSQLYIEPFQYAPSGGWELTESGQRRELTSTQCYPLVPSVVDSTSPVVVVKDQESECPWCQQKLVSLLTVDLQDPLFEEWRGDRPQLEILCCHVCACYGPVFCDLAADGTARWSVHNQRPSYLPEDASEWGRLPPQALKVVPERRSPYFAIDWTSGAPLSQIGGMPGWVQDAEYPGCPGCKKTMSFLAQISNEEIEEHSEGVYYLFLCNECGIGATNYQQT